MNIRFLTPALHGILDYMAAAGLLTLPSSSAWAVLRRWQDGCRLAPASHS
jgi:hypothetical protein